MHPKKSWRSRPTPQGSRGVSKLKFSRSSTQVARRSSSKPRRGHSGRTDSVRALSEEHGNPDHYHRRSHWNSGDARDDPRYALHEHDGYGHGVGRKQGYRPYWSSTEAQGHATKATSSTGRHAGPGAYYRGHSGTYYWADDHYYDPRISRPSEASPLPWGPVSYRDVDYASGSPPHLSPGKYARPELCPREASVEESERERPRGSPPSRPASRPASANESLGSTSRPASRPASPVACVLVCKPKSDEYTRHSLHFRADKTPEKPLQPGDQRDAARRDQKSVEQDYAELMERNADEFLRAVREGCSRSSVRAGDLRAPLGNTRAPEPTTPRRLGRQSPQSDSEGRSPSPVRDLRGKVGAKNRARGHGPQDELDTDEDRPSLSDWSDEWSDSRLDQVSSALKVCREEYDAVRENEASGDDFSDLEMPVDDLRWSLCVKKKVAKFGVVSRGLRQEACPGKDLRSALLAKRSTSCRKSDGGAKRLKKTNTSVQLYDAEDDSYDMDFSLLPKGFQTDDDESSTKNGDAHDSVGMLADDNLKPIDKPYTVTTAITPVKVMTADKINFSFFPKRMRAKDFWISDLTPSTAKLPDVSGDGVNEGTDDTPQESKGDSNAGAAAGTGEGSSGTSGSTNENASSSTSGSTNEGTSSGGSGSTNEGTSSSTIGSAVGDANSTTDPTTEGTNDGATDAAPEATTDGAASDASVPGDSATVGGTNDHTVKRTSAPRKCKQVTSKKEKRKKSTKGKGRRPKEKPKKVSKTGKK